MSAHMSPVKTSAPDATPQTRDEQFAAVIQEVIDFMAEHGRRPRFSGGTVEERGIALRFAHWRRVTERGDLRPQRKQLMHTALKAFNALPDRSPNIERPAGRSLEAHQVISFFEVHGRLPDYKTEATPYCYLRMVRSSLRHGTLSPVDVRALKTIPGVLKVTRREKLGRLAELQAWCANHGRLPRSDFHRDTTPEESVEAGLGQWMLRHVNRSRHESLETPETVHIRASILALRDAYPATGKVREDVQASAVTDFIQKFGRMPYVGRKHEHQLYQWAFKIRTVYRHGGAHRPAVVRMLELTEGLPDHLESQWDGVYAQLEEFVARQGRLPAAQRAAGRGRPSTESVLTEWLAREAGDLATVTEPSRQAKFAALLDSVALPRAA